MRGMKEEWREERRGVIPTRRDPVCVDCGEDHGEDEDEDEDTKDHEPRRMRRSLEKRGTEVRTSSLGWPTAAPAAGWGW
jgi:hypothetical protein